jgi:fluoroquinolone resistance protein
MPVVPGSALPDWFEQLIWDAAKHAEDGPPVVHDEDFASTDLRGARLERVSFVRCSFEEAALDQLVTEGSSFTDCSFDRAELVASAHLRTAFVACSFNRTGLQRASLTDCKLAGSVFTDTRLRTTTIAGGDWSGVSLGGADLRGLDLSGIRLVDANLVDARLDRVVFTGANLTGVRWSGASLTDADLRGALIDSLDPRVVNLTGARVEVDQAVGLARYLGLRIG